MIYPTSISAFFDDENLQILTNFVIVIFNTQVNSFRHDDNLSKFINAILASLI